MATLLSRTVATSPCPSVLNEVLEPERNLVIWERTPLSGVATLIEDVTRNVRFDASPSDLPTMLSRELEQANYPSGEVRDHFAADIEHLASLFAKALGLSRVSLRIEIVTTDSCRKWHADYVSARLITTYAGRGTQWIENRDADRVRNGLAPLHIHSLQTGDVGIFRGKLSSEPPAIHRSPPISGSGEKRLLLVLNPPEDS